MGIRDSRVPRLKLKDGWQATPLVGLTDWKSVLGLPDLDSEATISVQHVLHARQEWLEVAPTPYGPLLDALAERSKDGL